MRALFSRAGVDYDQWKALTKTALKLDFRMARLKSSGNRGPAELPAAN